MRNTAKIMFTLAMGLLNEPTEAQEPFACTGEAFIVQNIDAQLSQVDQNINPFVFIDIGDPIGIEIGNMGFRRTDGLLYAVELNASGNNQIIQIDSTGTAFGLGRPAGLPDNLRFDAGDVTPDGTTFYLNQAGSGFLYRVALDTSTCTSVGISGSDGSVFDWAVNPNDGLLYGGDSTDGQLATLDPNTGVRTDFTVGGLPAGTAYGGAWFNAVGNLCLYRNNGEIYEIDLSGSTIISTLPGPGSTRNDGAACTAEPVIDLVKDGSLDDGGDGATPGDLINYTFEVTNTGDVPLTNVTVTDPVVSPITCPTSTLALGAAMTCTGTYAITQADIDAGQRDNTATAIGDDPGGDPVSDQDDHSEPFVQSPTINLVKDGSLDDGGNGTNPGDFINYTFDVTNTGNVTLTNVSVTDPIISPISCPQTMLVPGESMTCIGSYAVTQADIDAGQRDNTATATGDDPGGDPVSDQDDHTEPFAQNPALDLVKSLQSNADEDGSGNASLHDTLTYSFVATNTGNVTLTAVTISDPLPGLSALACTPSQPTTLVPGQALNCTATYVVTVVDVAAKTIENTATASSHQTPDITDSKTVSVAYPELSVIKTGVLDPGANGVVDPGDLVDYTFQVTNSGTAEVTTIGLSDLKIPAITCPSGLPIPAIAPGASETCTGTYVITQTDINAGFVTNTVEANSDQVGPVEDSFTVPALDINSIPAPPGISIIHDVSYTETAPALSDGAPNYLMVWELEDGIRLRLTDPQNPGTELCPMSDSLSCPLIGSGGTQPATAFDAEGTGGGVFLVVWVQETAGTNCPLGHICGRVVDSDGTPRGTEFPVSGMPLGNEFQNPVVAVDKSSSDPEEPENPCGTTSDQGDFLVVWQSTALELGAFSGIEGRCVRAGEAVGDGVAIADEVHFPFRGMPLGNERWLTPRLAIDKSDPDHGALVVWQKESFAPDQSRITEIQGLHLVRGMPLGNEFQISVADQEIKQYPDVANDAASDSFLVVWEHDDGTSRDIRARQVKGGPIGDTFQVHDGFVTPSRPKVAGLDGQFFVAWQDVPEDSTTDSEIYAQYVDAAGHPTGDELRVSDFADNLDDLLPAVDATLDATRVVTTWRRAQATDLAITMSAPPEPSPATAGEPLTYRLQVSNNDGGSEPANEVVIEMAFPGATLQSSVGCDEDGEPPPAAGQAICRLDDDLATGASQEVILTVMVEPSVVGSLAFDARVVAAAPDRNPADNSLIVITPVTSNPLATVAADIDGDGDLDLVGAVLSDQRIGWWENETDDGSSWVPHPVHNSFGGAISVAVGDLDDDGDLDLVGAGSLEPGIVWWPNSDSAPLGSIQWPVNDPEFEPFPGVRLVILGDVDRDGDLDVTAASATAGVRWWRNLGAGAFAAGQSITESPTSALRLADVDLNGNPDVVTVTADGTIGWWQDADGDGFWNSQNVAAGFLGARSLAVADLDGDGRPDIVSAAADLGQVRWWRNVEVVNSVIWEEPENLDDEFPLATWVGTADLDNDGDLDVLGASAAESHLTWWENGGDGTAWSSGGSLAGAFAGSPSVALGDLDSDGDLDAAGQANMEGDVSWWRNGLVHGSTTYGPEQPIVEPPPEGLGTEDFSIVPADIDRDGDFDVFVAIAGAVSWWENALGEETQWVQNTFDSLGASVLTTADIDRDGAVDAIGASAAGIRWWKNPRMDTGAYWDDFEIAPFTEASSLLTADLDDDGDLDIVAVTETTGEILWWANPPPEQPSWIPRSIYHGADGAARAITAANFGGDGDVDILGVVNDQVFWWEQTPVVDPPWIQRLVADFPGATSVAAADLDQNGVLDVIAATDTSVWWWPGDETTGQGLAIAPDHGAQALAVADLDLDGDLDVFGASALGSHWWENQGVNATQRDLMWQPHPVGIHISAVAPIDVDRDGRPDLLGTADGVSWWRNRGGQFQLETEDVSTGIVDVGAPLPVFKITATHLGREGDSQLDLETFALRFSSANSHPFMDHIDKNVVVYLDTDGDGEFDVLSDEPVALDILTLADAIVDFTIILPENDPRVRLAFGETKTFFIVLELIDPVSPAHDLTVTHVTVPGSATETSTAKDPELGVRLVLEYVENVSSLSIACVPVELQSFTIE